MILRNKMVNGEWLMVNGQKRQRRSSIVSRPLLSLLPVAVVFLSGCATCKYSFNDVSIPVEVKTFRVNYLENKARYINPQLSPQLTERLKQKIIGTTRLTANQ